MVACNPLRHSGVVVMGGLGKALFALNLFYMRQNGWTSDLAVVVIAGAEDMSAKAEAILGGDGAESDARRAAERLALNLAAAALLRHAPKPVADAFVSRRLRASSLTFGAGEGAIDVDQLMSRLTLEI
ncbi:MAG: hypothetical protein ABL864_10470 [Terricaulis sp.]|jgi:hypothetical protein